MMLKGLVSLMALTLCMSALLGAESHSADDSSADLSVRLHNSSVSLKGESSESVRPDNAAFTLVVNNCGKGSRADAVKDNAGLTNAVKAAVESSGYAGSISTESYSIYEKTKSRYDSWGNYRDSVVECYDVTHKLRVQTDEPDKIGGLIDIGMGSGATDVEDMAFSLSDSTRSELSKGLSRKALEDADAKLAYLLPQARNATLEKLTVSISYGSWNHYPGYTFGAGGYLYDESEEFTEVAVPELDVKGTAQAVYSVSG